MSEKNKYNQQIIIGSGVAGLTAAIYSARAVLEPLVFEGEPARRPAYSNHRGRELPWF